jgi:hypothetical protein
VDAVYSLGVDLSIGFTMTMSLRATFPPFGSFLGSRSLTFTEDDRGGTSLCGASTTSSCWCLLNSVP